MKEMIKIDDFSKLNLRVGEIKNISKENVKISCLAETFISKIALDVKSGNQIVISSVGGKIFIPVVKEDIPLVPEKKIDSGSKVR